jgi:AcrR family transcriptional regulator
MSKGEETREMILERAAQVFNKQGYSGASMTDIMRETGLEKGGIYNHFKNKEELALAAFDYASGLTIERFRKALKGKTGAIERLMAWVNTYRELADKPLIKGGCPVLNTATEVDDTNPALRTRTRQVMDNWYSLIRWTVIEGVEKRELKPETDADMVATMFLTSYEGAVMMARLYRNSAYIHRVADHLERYVETLKA